MSYGKGASYFKYFNLIVYYKKFYKNKKVNQIYLKYFNAKNYKVNS